MDSKSKYLLSRFLLGQLATAILGLLLTHCVTRAASAPAPGDEVDNFMLLDQDGVAHELKRTDAKAVVLFFSANDCPIARQNMHKLKALQQTYAAKGVEFLVVNTSTGDDWKSIRSERYSLGALTLPVVKDDTQGLTRRLKVRRTGELIAISTADWKIFYRGAIDDQAVEGAQKPEPTQHYLKSALEEFLHGKKVTVSSSNARGCLIRFEVEDRFKDRPISFREDVFPILKHKCVGCHSPGNIGSWSMKSYGKVHSMASMIEEVVLTQRMPPWDANPRVGQISAPNTLSRQETQTLLYWIEQGAQNDAKDDPLAGLVVPPAPDWPLGEPDIVIKLPAIQRIPATGVLEYRRMDVSLHNSSNLYVGSFYVKPGNKKTVHHAGGRLRRGKPGHLEGEFTFAWAPGSTQGWQPDQSAQILPTNAVIELELHYTPCGTEETDDTQIGVYLMKEPPKAIFDTLMIFNTDFQIPPGDPNHRVQAMIPIRSEITLHGVVPHMHLRGKWMRFDVLFPNGKREALCEVPRYDFNWQQSYMLSKPRKLPPGAWVVVSGGFDNSSRNPTNPDPNKIVRWGDQSFEEMFLGTLLFTRKL